MIEVVIKRYTTEKYCETINFTATEKPTEVIEESEYGNKRKVAYERTFTPVEAEKTRTVERVLLKQEITDESLFNLTNVIRAVNGIDEVSVG